MELALYCPDHGFYEREKYSVGRHGDFYTSVSVGPLFGQMLAFQFATWMETESQTQPSKINLIESGAHDGKLAGDILRWFQNRRPQLFAQMEYWIVEPSPRRQAWQRQRLAEFSDRVRWVSALEDLGKVNGVIFSNELLDAFPVRRLGWDAANKNWFEWGVSWAGEKFSWARMRPTETPDLKLQLPNLPAELLAVLPEGFTTEICPAAANWWRTAAGLLARGKLLTLDYGLAAEEFFQPGRAAGTLRSYRRHQAGADVLANAGAQDITAHVNFSGLQSVGEAAGLKTETFVSQAKFLTDLAGRLWQPQSGFGEWTPSLTRQLQTLTHPEHLGRPFRVLVQSR